MPDISIFQLLLLELFVFGASTASGITTFGFGMIMSPLFLFFLPPRLVVELNVALFAALSTVIAVQARRSVDWKIVAALMLGSVITMPFGIVALNALNDSTLRLLIIGTALVQVFIPMIGLRHRFHREWIAFIPVGAAVGFLATTVALGGPLVVLLALNQGWDKARTRANLSTYFAMLDGLVVVSHSLAGFYRLSELATTALFLPPLALGGILASRLITGVNEKLFRYAVLAVLFGTSFGIVGKEIFHLVSG